MDNSVARQVAHQPQKPIGTANPGRVFTTSRATLSLDDHTEGLSCLRHILGLLLSDTVNVHWLKDQITWVELPS